MDRLLARRLERDEDFSKKILTLVSDYVSLGQRTTDYWAADFDVSHDLLMCYAPLSKTDLDQLDRGHPKRFVLPMTATQITTMATFIAQMLFGDDSPHKVEGRGPEDEVSAEHLNQLLRWNDEQQPSYLLGYLWVQDVLCYNRGVRYNSWSPIYETRVEMVDVTDDEENDPDTGHSQVYQRPQKTRVAVAGYNRVHLVSPYDFFCDPMLPLWRFQDGRFAGHRTTVAWHELESRSKLSIDDPAYILPSAIKKLKDKKDGKGRKGNDMIGGTVPGGQGASRSNAMMSRTAFERNRSGGTGSQEANKEDPGMIDVREVYVRLVPSDHELYDSQEPVLFQMLVANSSVVLAVNEAPNKHDQFPYNVAEGRPSAYYQFSPSWVLMIKPLQDYIDYLKNRRQQSIARTGGNMFIARPDKINIADFLDPDKDGLIIPLLPEAEGHKLDDIIKQVPVIDTTKDFNAEMKDFASYAEVVTGVNSSMQGQLDDTTTATQFQGTQQMSAGRLASVARLLSVQGLVPETKQFVANYQQFLTVPMSLRFVPHGMDSPTSFQGQRALQVSPDTIQGTFDYIMHDGSLPGTDSRKVAAISRLLEMVPLMPQYFTPGPGNIDARALLLAAAKAASLNIENFQFSEQTPPPAEQPGQPGLPPGEAPPGALPNLGAEPGTMPGNGPGRPATPDMAEVPTAAPPQIHPAQL